MSPTEMTSQGNYPDEEFGICKIDSWLKPFATAIKRRHESYKKWEKEINQNEGGFAKFSRGYERFGLNVQQNGDIVYREWAPNAKTASLIGEFNDWDRSKHPMKKDSFGVWEVHIPAKNSTPAIPHNTKVKISMTTPEGERIDRLPAWIKRVTQDLNVSPAYDAVFWNPPQKYVWKNNSPQKPTSLRIYEAHVGISTTEGRVGTYDEFTNNVLKRIKDLGYNAIQLMAIMEHAYYASFGYQVTSFFAISSRYGKQTRVNKIYISILLILMGSLDRYTRGIEATR